jgi:type I restriction enzyme S subunit
MGKLKKYSSYKESGVEWLGEIPQKWNIEKIKYNATIFSGNSISDHQKSNYENISLDSIPYVSTKDLDMDYSTIDYDNGLRISIIDKSFKVANSHSTLLCIEGGSAGRKIAYLNQNVCFVNKLASVTSSKDNNSKYMYYLIKSSIFKNQFDLSMNGLIGGVSLSVLKNFELVFPPKQEQIKIASYLDTKTEQLDKSIKQKKQLITLLKERRQILINDAVTKGIDKAVAMKDSGVEWIGDIPEDWNIVPGLTVYKENKTKNIGMKDDRVLSLSYGKIVVKPKEKLTGLVPESFETYQIVKPGDIIIRCMDLQNDQTSLRTAISINDGIITSAYLNLNIIDDFNSNYLHYYLHSLDTTKVLYKLGSGLRQNLSYWDFKRLPIVKPSKEKQQEILEYIEKNNQKIDKAIDLQQQQITKLKEYKATLIDSVVTGKVRIV